jgi:protoheme IX farnesyltransferase
VNRKENRVKAVNIADSRPGWIAEWKALVKFRLSATVVFSAVMAYIIASGGVLNWTGIVVLTLGGFLVTAAANTLNQILETDYDALMKRTADRPLAAGRMRSSTALVWAGFMSLFGIVFLAMFNPWTALLGMISLISYSFIYTPLKRVSPLAVLVGAIPGALPMMIGAVAAEGAITSLALTLFTIQFFWQFPHFWSIAWLGNEDYQRAGFNLLPTGKMDASVGNHSMVLATALIPTFLYLFFIGQIGMINLVLLSVLSAIYAYFGLLLAKNQDRLSARRLMFGSLLFLPVVLTLILVSSYITGF